MSAPATYVLIIVSMVASVWCWWRVWRSDDPAIFKVVLTLIAGLPFIGPFFYLFIGMPPRHRRLPERKHIRPVQQSAFMKRWNEREHIYLGWASVIFWALAVVAYWMNDWTHGRVHYMPWLWANYTDVDIIFFSLLIGAVLTFGAAVRAKVILERRIRQASNYLLQSTGQKQPATE